LTVGGRRRIAPQSAGHLFFPISAALSRGPARVEPTGSVVSSSVLRQITWAPVAVLAVAGVPFAAFAVLVLHHFYARGGFFYDSGLLAFLLSEQDPRLPTPHIFGGGSFFATHVTPVFVVLALIRRLLPVTDPQVFVSASFGCCIRVLVCAAHSGRQSLRPSL